MANPTTNYGFVLPTPTDLVTDLPADFDVALQGVDTRLKALQPGTTSGDLAYSSATANTNVRLPIGSTNQVLSVVAGVPAWATTADVTPLTTKGDLFTFSTVDARLAVGATNGMVLTVDSAEATGLKYATPTGGKVVQIIAATTTTYVANSTSTFADTTLTATITPTSASNKVLVSISQNGIQKGTSDTALDLILLRTSTTIGNIPGILKTNDTGAIIASCSLSILDSPATTSATTYKTQFRSAANSAGVGVQDYSTTPITDSTIILMEVTP